MASLLSFGEMKIAKKLATAPPWFAGILSPNLFKKISVKRKLSALKSGTLGDEKSTS